MLRHRLLRRGSDTLAQSSDVRYHMTLTVIPAVRTPEIR